VKRCPACHEAYAIDVSFCEKCGETLVRPAHVPPPGLPTLPATSPPSDVPVGSSDEARPVVEVGPYLSVPRALSVVRQALELATRFERDALAWTPQPEDFVLGPDGAVTLRSARAVGRMSAERPFDVTRVLGALREALLPEPLFRAGAAIIELLWAPRGSIPSVRAALERLDDAERVLAGTATMSATALAPVAGACHLGLMRPRNDDAVEVAHGDAPAPWIVLVVCDGVSSSSHGDVAATVGARAARASLEQAAAAAPPSDLAMRDRMERAILAAHEAIVAANIDREEGREAPGSTIVAALRCGGRVAVGWAGDSRAYLVSGHKGYLLTRDHSWGNHAIDVGQASAEDVASQPMAQALTRCIGPLESGDGTEVRPDVVVFPEPTEPSRLVLCSDGLWGYFPHAFEMVEAVGRAGRLAPPALVARLLVDQALARGGQDNVAVAVCELGPAPSE
jgi:serine/threonine protein phosphatase PrpC